VFELADDSRRKKLLFIGSILVAIMFISSAAAFGNFGSPPSSSTSTVSGPSYFMVGQANATVNGWSQNVQVTVNSSNSTYYSDVANVIIALQANGTIGNYASINNVTFSAYLVNMTAYAFQSRLDAMLGNSVATVKASTMVALPAQITMYYYSQPVPVLLQSGNYPVSIEPLQPRGALVPVKIQGTVTQTGNVIGPLTVIYEG
jgi:hypothetical protein